MTNGAFLRQNGAVSPKILETAAIRDQEAKIRSTLFQIEFVNESTIRLYLNGQDIRPLLGGMQNASLDISETENNTPIPDTGNSQDADEDIDSSLSNVQEFVQDLQIEVFDKIKQTEVYSDYTIPTSSDSEPLADDKITSTIEDSDYLKEDDQEPKILGEPSEDADDTSLPSAEDVITHSVVQSSDNELGQKLEACQLSDKAKDVMIDHEEQTLDVPECHTSPNPEDVTSYTDVESSNIEHEQEHLEDTILEECQTNQISENVMLTPNIESSKSELESGNLVDLAVDSQDSLQSHADEEQNILVLSEEKSQDLATSDTGPQDMTDIKEEEAKYVMIDHEEQALDVPECHSSPNPEVVTSSADVESSNIEHEQEHLEGTMLEECQTNQISENVMLTPNLESSKSEPESENLEDLAVNSQDSLQSNAGEEQKILVLSEEKCQDLATSDTRPEDMTDSKEEEAKDVMIDHEEQALDVPECHTSPNPEDVTSSTDVESSNIEHEQEHLEDTMLEECQTNQISENVMLTPNLESSKSELESENLEDLAVDSQDSLQSNADEEQKILVLSEEKSQDLATSDTGPEDMTNIKEEDAKDVMIDHEEQALDVPERHTSPNPEDVTSSAAVDSSNITDEQNQQGHTNNLEECQTNQISENVMLTLNPESSSSELKSQNLEDTVASSQDYLQSNADGEQKVLVFSEKSEDPETTDTGPKDTTDIKNSSNEVETEPKLEENAEIDEKIGQTIILENTVIDEKRVIQESLELEKTDCQSNASTKSQGKSTPTDTDKKKVPVSTQKSPNSSKVSTPKKTIEKTPAKKVSPIKVSPNSPVKVSPKKDSVKVSPNKQSPIKISPKRQSSEKETDKSSKTPPFKNLSPKKKPNPKNTTPPDSVKKSSPKKPSTEPKAEVKEIPVDEGSKPADETGQCSGTTSESGKMVPVSLSRSKTPSDEVEAITDTIDNGLKKEIGSRPASSCSGKMNYDEKIVPGCCSRPETPNEENMEIEATPKTTLEQGEIGSRPQSSCSEKMSLDEGIVTSCISEPAFTVGGDSEVTISSMTENIDNKNEVEHRPDSASSGKIKYDDKIVSALLRPHTSVDDENADVGVSE